MLVECGSIFADFGCLWEEHTLMMVFIAITDLYAVYVQVNKVDLGQSSNNFTN